MIYPTLHQHWNKFSAELSFFEALLMFALFGLLVNVFNTVHFYLIFTLPLAVVFSFLMTKHAFFWLFVNQRG